MLQGRRPRTPAQSAADARLRAKKAAIRDARDAERQAECGRIQAARDEFNSERLARGLKPLDFDGRPDFFTPIR